MSQGGSIDLAFRRAGARATATIGLLIAGIVWSPASTTMASDATRSVASDGAASVSLTAATVPAPFTEQTTAAPIDTGEWGPVLDWGVQAKHMVTLSTGKVLVW